MQGADLDSWKPGPIWAGDPCVILASGPSLTIGQVRHVERAHEKRGIRCIAINTTYTIAPYADVLYACDLKWWEWYDGAREFEGLRVTINDKAAMKYGLLWLRGESRKGLSTIPGVLHEGQNGGFQALNLAVQLGANPIYLIGYDMRIDPGESPRWHGHHRDRLTYPLQTLVHHFEDTVEQLQTMGVDVINCTPGSAIKCYQEGSIFEET